MDAEHRHELKTNELAHWLAHTPDFLKKNASTIIGAVLIIVGLITWPMFTRMRESSDITKAAAVTSAIQTMDRDVAGLIQAAEKDDEARRQASGALLVSANALLDQAGKTDNADLAALARIKAAQALRTELHLRAERVGTEDVQSRISQAQEAYQKALTTATTPTLKAMAKFGLALCAEELGQRDAAAALYKEIIDTPEFGATVFPTQAQKRLAGLDENLETFVFAPAPAAPTATEPGVLPTELTPPVLPENAVQATGTTEVVAPGTESTAPVEQPAQQ